MTVLLGNNDVCAPSLAEMTDPALFEAQYRDGLDILAQAPFSETLNLLISGVPDIYWLWNAKRTSLYCRLIAWPFVPCQNLLDNPVQVILYSLIVGLILYLSISPFFPDD
mgnify:CR=1 FL=1